MGANSLLLFFLLMAMYVGYNGLMRVEENSVDTNRVVGWVVGHLRMITEQEYANYC